MNLKDWTITFIRHRDLMRKEIIDIEECDEGIICKYKDKVHMYFVSDLLSDNMISLIKDDMEKITIVCLNKRTNLDFLVKHWGALENNPGLNLIFANPELNGRWIIFPYTHSRITEKEALERGLESLFSSIEEA